MNVAIDEHDHPYYGADSRYLIGVGSKKFRGTDKAYRFATLESVKRGERFVLSVMRRDQLDGIDKSKEVKTLIEHAVFMMKDLPSFPMVLFFPLPDRSFIAFSTPKERALSMVR